MIFRDALRDEGGQSFSNPMSAFELELLSRRKFSLYKFALTGVYLLKSERKYPDTLV
jgi:hypothetical protein